MKRMIQHIISFSLVFFLLFAFVGCRKNPTDNSSLGEEIEYVYVKAPSSENSSEIEEPPNASSQPEQAVTVQPTID